MDTTCELRKTSATDTISSRQRLDETLLESIAAGDRFAMQVLFQRHNVQIYRFVLRLSGNAAAAEEIVSEVFLEVWRHAATFQARCQVTTWLLTIARHKAISALRRHSEAPLDDEDSGHSRGPERGCRSRTGPEGPQQADPGVSGAAVAVAPRDHRSGLLPRQIGRRGSRHRRGAEEHRQDTHVLCPQPPGQAAAGGRELDPKG